MSITLVVAAEDNGPSVTLVVGPEGGIGGSQNLEFADHTLGIIKKSPNGTRRLITIDDNGDDVKTPL